MQRVPLAVIGTTLLLASCASPRISLRQGAPLEERMHLQQPLHTPRQWEPIMAINPDVARYCRVSPADMRRVMVKPEDVGRPDEWTDEEIAAITALADKSYDVVQKMIRTPREAALYCIHVLSYPSDVDSAVIDTNRFGGDFWMSGARMQTYKTGDCDDGAVAAASALKDNGFLPYIASIDCVVPVVTKEGKLELQERSHAIFMYKTHEGKFGSIGLNQCDIVVPQAQTIEQFLRVLSWQGDYRATSCTIYDISRAVPDYDTTFRNTDPGEWRGPFIGVSGR